MPVWLVRVGLSLLRGIFEDGPTRKVLVVTLCLLLLLILLPAMIVGVGVSLLFWSPGAANGTGIPPDRIGMWLPLIEQEDVGHGVPPALVLGMIAHESRGNWHAVHLNSNGTEDAGLMQVNSSHWTEYGIEHDPFAPPENLSTGLDILAAGIPGCAGDVGCALEAYNGGRPGYATAVLSATAGVESAHLAVWPLGQGQLGTVAALPAPAEATFALVAWTAGWSKAEVWQGARFAALEGPSSIHATDGSGQPAQIGDCRHPPAPVAVYLPPYAGCTLLIVPVVNGQASVDVTVRFPDGQMLSQSASVEVG